MGYETTNGRRPGIAPELRGAIVLIALALLAPGYLFFTAVVKSDRRCVVTEKVVPIADSQKWGRPTGLRPGDPYRPDSACAPGDTPQRRELRFGLIPAWVNERLE